MRDPPHEIIIYMLSNENTSRYEDVRIQTSDQNISMSTVSAATTTTTVISEEPPQQEAVLIPSLPSDIAINILARIPRSHHPFISLVSKPFRSLISSPILYNTRFLLHCAQPFLYLSLRIPTTTSLHWFTVHQNPNADSNPKPFFLVPLPPTPAPLVGSAFAHVGPVIFVIGGSINDVPSSHVWSLDCRFHTWEPLPNMNVSREFAAAGVVDGKVYVMGGCVVDSWSRSRNWAEVFDPKTGRWEAVSSVIDGLLREKWMHGSAVVKGKIYAMADMNGVVYEPKSGEWEGVPKRLDLGWRGRACVVDDILYCYDYVGNIRGFDVEDGVWKNLRGLEKALPRFLSGATMANLGGKLVVVWEGERCGNGKEKEIWCANIDVQKKEDGGLWGKIEWSNIIHKVASRSAIVHCIGVTI